MKIEILVKAEQDLADGFGTSPSTVGDLVKSITLHPDADAELIEAARYYELRQWAWKIG